MALDRAHNRLFIPAYGNGGYRAFQLDEDGLPADRSAMYVIGRESIYGRRSNPVPSEYELNFPGAITVFDSSTQRLFGLDRFNNRILVFRAHPDEVEKYQAANVVIGQKDFTSTERGISARRAGMMASAALDEKGQRMFVADPPNSRVLVFDIHPDRLDSDPAASFVIGQVDFDSRERGVGAARFAGPSSVAYDPVFERLFVSDRGNHRVLVFDVHPDRLGNNPEAIAVMGQPDFDAREPRNALDKLKPESLAYDWVNHRLFIAEDLEHRVMVYDAHPDRVGGPATALAVIGQPDAFSTHPAVSQNRIAMPRLAVESETQKLYISEGFPAGNRISIFDISPGKIETGMVASDVVGHETPAGGPDFEARMAQGHLHGRTLAAARAVALDPVDHRLFVADEYNHRVVVWQLDAMNRVGDRSAQWVLGQPDLETSLMGEPSAVNMTVPLAVVYDTSTKRLYVGDGYHNRVLVYDAAPGTLANGMAASYVLGQKDMTSVENGAGAEGLRFGVRMGRGIASNFLPMGLAVDEPAQRLFVSDGENNRVLVYDVGEGQLRDGAPAKLVLGQPDFETTEPGRAADKLHDPGHLAYDPERGRLFVVDGKNKRVLVFDAREGSLVQGARAVRVLGQPDFDSGPPPPGPRVMGSSSASTFDDASFLAPNGIALDVSNELLYVTDSVVPADRVLVFDVSQDGLVNGATAIAVMGASDAEAGTRRFFGGPKSFPGQFTIRDARGIAVDPAYGRLFVTGSFSSRVTVFHFPRARWPVAVAAHGLEYFHTPDAIDIGARQQPPTVSTASIPMDGSAIVSVSEMFVDERTKRHSRMLISEVAMSPAEVSTGAAYYVDGAAEREHRLYILNTGTTEASVRLTLYDEHGDEDGAWERRVAADAQLALVLEELTDRPPESGTLVVASDAPLAVAALRVTTNQREQQLFAPMPSSVSSMRATEAVIPWLINGAGDRSEVVLVNSSDTESLRGTLAIYDRSGARAPLGMDSELMPYAIPPRSARRFVSDGAGASSETGYAVVTAEDGQVPGVSALVRHLSGDTATSESLVSESGGPRHRFGVNLETTLIRHGEIDTVIYATNAGSSLAQVHVAMDGDGGATFERMLAPGQQRRMSVRDLFGASARGILSVESDAPISVTARQRTVNLRGELIEVELPALGSGRRFPYIPNGKGLSTELRLANPSVAEATGFIELWLANGEPALEAILR